MPELDVVMTGLTLGESPRWHDGRLWVCNWIGGQVLAVALDGAVGEGRVAEWYEGAHGRRGETYAGEAEFYGAELWDLTSRDWMAGSELALAIVRLEAAGRLERPRDFHWRRRVHLFSNQLLLDEIGLCLHQAAGYIRMRHADDPRFTETLRAIDRLLA